MIRTRVRTMYFKGMLFQIQYSALCFAWPHVTSIDQLMTITTDSPDMFRIHFDVCHSMCKIIQWVIYIDRYLSVNFT